eukprot:CAMPEP_0172481592 /NCGR_PEP_ID=MMETSP1066-20121228/7590_1 /TAXON_ID=671091 /ORGANISM="Coscinodiscus wailesii, Strain CCMP2513" /LENGTH=277 /DNA_ID=CAMNT_0013244037 /DNA_START=51 /DNA_END=884 /DNA_ORIENTATION=-
MNKRTKTDDKVTQTKISKRKTQTKDVLYSLEEDINAKICSFLKIKDIGTFRITSKYFRRNIKMTHTQEHCNIIANNLKQIYSCGGWWVLRQMLMDDARVDPSINNNEAICWACLTGDSCLVKGLLMDERVDPSVHYDLAICKASAYGHLGVVQELLRDTRVDPSAQENYALRKASVNGHLAIVQELLKDSRVDPSADDNLIIDLVSAAGNVIIIRVLLQEPRVDSSFAILNASKKGDLDVLRVLLMNSHEDSSDYYSEEIRMAKNGHLEYVVQKLTR